MEGKTPLFDSGCKIQNNRQMVIDLNKIHLTPWECLVTLCPNWGANGLVSHELGFSQAISVQPTPEIAQPMPSLAEPTQDKPLEVWD